MASQLTYPPEHWSNDPDPASALSKYLELSNSHYNRVEESCFLSLLPKDMHGLTVLDFGCGCGRLSVLCAKRGAQVTGIDRAEHAINAARLYAHQEGVSDRCTFAVRPGIPDEEYDVIVAKDVIEHIEDDAAWIRAAAKALAPNGRLVLSTQNSWSLNYLIEGSYHRLWHGNRLWMGWDPTHVRFYNPISLRRIAKMGGMKVERWASMYIVPYDVLTWLLLLRKAVTFPALRYVDHLLGRVFPFNRLGWTIMASCRKR